MIRNDGLQPDAVQGLPAYGSGRFVRSCATPAPIKATAAAQGQRRIFGAGGLAGSLLLLLLLAVVSMN